MKRKILRAVTMIVMASALAVGVHGTPPAGADPAFTHLATNTLSPQYLVNGCKFRVRYGNFGSAAYAQLRVYPVGTSYASCATAGVSVGYHDGTTESSVSETFSTTTYVTGTDGCGAYREIQATTPVVAYATFALAAAPNDPTDPTWFNGWRFFSSDGQGTLPVNSTC